MSQTKNLVDRSKDETMVLLHLALQEGFTGDVVTIRVNGTEMFHKPDVKTRLQIGYADSIDVNTQEGLVKIEVLLPKKNLSETVVVQLVAALYVGVSLVGGKIHYQMSNEPFGYL